MTRVAIKLGLALLILLSVFATGYASAPRVKEYVEVVDTLSLTRALERARGAELEASGLRSRLRGIREAKPDTIFIVKDSIPPPDTVMVYVTVNSLARAEVGRLTRWDSVSARYTDNRILSGYDLSRCDDGYSFGARGVNCNVPRLGHLYVVGTLGIARGVGGPRTSLPDLAAGVGMIGEIGVEWEHFYRSKYSVSLTVGLDEIVRFGVRRRFELF